MKRSLTAGIIFFIILAGCGRDDNPAAPVNTPDMTKTAEVEATRTNIALSFTPTETLTITLTITHSPTITMTKTATCTATGTFSASPTPSITDTDTDTATPSCTPTFTCTPSVTETVTLTSTPYAVHIGTFGSQGTSCNGCFSGGASLSVDSEHGVLYAADAGNDRIQYFSTGGTYLGQWGGTGTTDGLFDGPLGISADGAGNRVYVVEYYNHRVQYFSLAGAYLGQWGGYGTDSGKFKYPYAIDVDHAGGRVYVTDDGNSISLERAQYFDLDGAYIGEFGNTGSYAQQISHSYAICSDNAEGKVFARNYSVPSIQCYGLTGSYIFGWGDDYPQCDTCFWEIRAMSIDHTRKLIYTADRQLHRIQFFDLNGNFKGKFGSFGTGYGYFDEPVGIAVDSSTGYVYVYDMGNFRIDIFQVFY